MHQAVRQPERMAAPALFPAPVHQRMRIQGAAHGGEPVLPARRSCLVRDRLQHTLRDQLLQAQREGLARDVQAGAQVIETLDAKKRHQDHQDGPAIADPPERQVERAAFERARDGSGRRALSHRAGKLAGAPS